MYITCGHMQLILKVVFCFQDKLRSVTQSYIHTTRANTFSAHHMLGDSKGTKYLRMVQLAYKFLMIAT